MAPAQGEVIVSELGNLCAKEFLHNLSADEQGLFRGATVAGSLLKEIETVNTEHKDASWSRKASASLLPFIAGIEQYGPALDVFANSNDLLCPVWGSVRIVLQFAKDFGEYFDRIAGMLEEIGNILLRLPRAMRLYPDNKNLQKAVLAIYQDIFEFTSRARDVFRVGKSRSHGLLSMKHAVGFAAALRLVWKPFDVQFGVIKERILKSVGDIETEADMAEKELAQQERQKDDVRWSRQEAAQRLLAEFIDEESMDKVNEWLSPANVAPNHKLATNLRHADSGTWFLHGDSFRQFLAQDNAFLWLHAIPGAGKTVLASSIINYLQDHVQSKSTGLAYFYCQYNDINKQEPSKVLGTILASLGKQNHGVFEAIQTFFQKQYRETSTFSAEFDELLNNFASFVNGHFASVYIVVDALDEAGSANMECLTYAFKLLHSQCKSLKILITSRNELPIARAFEGLPESSIEQSDVTSDITNYITAELTAKIAQRKLKLRNPALADTIRTRLVEGAKGMFQWAKCQIEALCKSRNDKAITAALDNLPKTLHATYTRILKRVEDDHPDDIEVVRKILCWLVRGVRNLTLDELAEAVAIDPENDDTFMDFDAVDTDPEDILEQLGGLVTVSDRNIALAHYSVKEFLVSEDLRLDRPRFYVGAIEAESLLASVCLTYLCYDDFKEPELAISGALQEKLEKYRLYRYAAQAWACHASQSEKDGHQLESVVDLTMRLFHSNFGGQRHYGSWIECYQYYKFSKHASHRVASPLFVTAYFGLAEAAQQVLEEIKPDTDAQAEALRVASSNGHVGVIKVILEHMEQDANHNEEQVQSENGIPSEETENDSTLQQALAKALYLASAKGHTEVISLLLEHKAPVNARGGRDGTALQAAALEGRADAVKLLLENGASHWEACKRYGTPLAAAAEKAHQRTAGVLLDHGANPNSRGGWYSLPLVSAIVGKNLNLVRRLIEADADVNAVGGRYGGPLPAAAALGMNSLIEELIGYGAKVNDNDDKASDALYAASLAGHISTVALLLKLGADVDAKGGRHRNALGAASSEGHLEVVEMLLDAGADVEFLEEHWGNAVQTAAQRGHEEVVRMLADAGVDANAPGGDKGTALVGAATNGHNGVIKCLFELEEPVPAGPTIGMTNALVAAAGAGHLQTVNILIDYGADVNKLASPSQTATYCTPLQAAASKGNIEIVQNLIERGAEANTTDQGWFGTPLMAAAQSDSHRAEILTILLDSGAQVDAISLSACHYRGTALAHVSSGNDASCATLLLDRGADINLHSQTFSTPLEYAAEKGHDSLVDLLLSRGADLNLVRKPLGKWDKDLISQIETGTILETLTALQAAAYNGHDDLVRKLVNLGAELSVSVDKTPFISALQAAAYCGHTDVVKTLVELGSDVNERGGYFGSALQAAACKGRLEPVRILLEAGAVANEIDVGYFKSALVAICRIEIDSNIEIAKLLVEHGADVNQKQKGPYPYPLHATARYLCHAAADPIEVLLEAGANPNLTGGKYGTALQAATCRGGAAATKLLLDHEADPNITGGYYTTPLQAAYRLGWYNIIDLLITRGARTDITGNSRAGSVMGQALGCMKGVNDDGYTGGACETLVNQLLFHRNFDVNLQYRPYGNALQNVVVTGRGYDEVLMMLNAGADVNKVGGRLGTAVNAAAWAGNEEILNELLSRGADINLGNHRYPNAAFGAIRGMELKVLKTLIDKGVDVKSASGLNGNTVQCAAHFGLLPYIRILLRAGADVNTPACGKFGSPLQAAIARRHIKVTRYLVNKGADIHAKGGRFGSILNAAALSSDHNFLEMLLKNGVNVNEPGVRYGTPLQGAACEGKLLNVMVLLHYGADVNMTGGRYHTALQAACVAGNFKIAKLLIERGADPNVTGGKFRTALNAAAIRGNEKLVRYLVQEANAKWRLVERNRLGHVRPSRLDAADNLLQRVLEPAEPVEVLNELSIRVATNGKTTHAESNGLQWNVESIPTYVPPASKWTSVRELSLHTFSSRYLKTVAERGNPLGTNLDEAHDSGIGFGGSTRVNSLASTRSGRSRQNSKLLARTKSLPAEEHIEWDSNALNWVEV